MTLNDLGKFDTFDDVKSAYKESKLASGDYVTVDGTIYYWNAMTASWCLTCPIEEDAPEETDLSSMTEASPTETDLSTGTEKTPKEEDLSSVAEDEGRGNHDHDENITFENNLTVASDTRTRRLFANWATISGLLRSGELRVDGILSAGSIVADSITNLDDVINGLVANMFIRKDRKDKTPYLVQFLAGLEYGLYAAGGKNGGKLHEGGLAEVGRLQVNGNSELRGNLSSKDFISGFTAGKGWAMQMKKYLNAAGTEETRSVLELDDLIVRGTMRVFEFIVNQMLGENDNRTFTGMMEVDHYDPETGKVYLDTHDGKLYNPFRKDDIVIVQQFNGMPTEEHNYYLTKQYELLITEASVGSMSDGEKRLDWVKFTNFTTTMEGATEEIITQGDTLVRIDNLTDERRKGIIQIMTVGDNTPYMDIIFGKKTDPENALKGRLGNLQGIYHHLFGWLEGFGELLTNLYAIGDFRLRQTGEDIDSKIEILKGSFSTSYKKLAYDITEEDNYLKNATFTENMEHWQTGEDNINFLAVGDEAVILNRSTVVVKDSFALIEEYEGREMLHLCNDWVKQLNADIRKPGTHKEYKRAADDTCDEYVEVPDTLYLSVKLLARTSGTLTIGMQDSTIDTGSLPYSIAAIEKSSDWQTLQWSGTWEGKGDFLLKYTGDLYVSLLSLTDKPLDEYKKEVSTAIEQTASNIRLLGTNINNLKGTVTNLGIDLDAAKERITLYADKVDNLEGTVTNLGIRIDAAEENITLYAKKTNDLEGTVTDLGIRLDAAEGDITLYAKKVGNNEAAISALQIKDDSIVSTVTSVQGDLEQAKATAAAAAKAAMDKALEAVGDADDAWWKAYYAQQAADKAQGTADDAYGKSVSNATAIAQTDSAVSVLAGRFTSDGRLVNTGGLLVTADKTELSNEIYDINGKLAKKAEVSTSVQYNPSTGKVTTNIKLGADQIELEGHVTANGNVEITPDGKIIAKWGMFENTVMRYKVNDISFLTTKVYYDTWANINGISSDSLYEYDLAILSTGTYINGVWHSARRAFAWRNNKWKALEGLSVYTSTDSNGNVSVSYAVLDLNPENGNIVVLDAPVKIYVVVPETGEGNYGTQIRLMSMTQVVARNPISSQWNNREYHVGRYSYSSSENIVMTGRAGSTINIGGHCELISTPLGWIAKANVGMVNECMIARLKVQYIAGSKTYSISAECLYNYHSGNFSATRDAAGKVVVSIPYALVEDIGSSDVKVYGTGVVWNADNNTVASTSPCKATLQFYYQETTAFARALVLISDDETLNDGDFVMEIYKYSNTYIRAKGSITG